MMARVDGRETGLTYREVAERGGRYCPPLHIPDYISHLALWYWQLRDYCPPGPDATDTPITPRLIMEWQEMEGLCVSPLERGILFSMDRAYRSGMAKQREDVRRRESQK